MELKEGMSVFTPGGEEVGKVNRFILDPATNEVTHVVIEKGWLLPEDKVVPFEMVSSAMGESVVLNEDVGDLEKLSPFEEMHFVRVTDDYPIDLTPGASPAYRYGPSYYWYPAQPNLGFPSPGMVPYTFPAGETQRNIPDDTVPLKEGANIISSDGKHVGDVGRLFLEDNSNTVTHFLISQGILFKDRKLIPEHWVGAIEENKVHLVVPSRILERLPSYEE